MSIRTDMQKGQSALKRRMLANLRDCQAKPNYSFSPPIVATEFTRHVEAIAKARAA